MLDLFSDRSMFSVRSAFVFVAHFSVNRFYCRKKTHCPDSHSQTYPENRFSLSFHFMLVARTLIHVYFLLNLPFYLVGYTDI